MNRYRLILVTMQILLLLVVVERLYSVERLVLYCKDIDISELKDFTECYSTEPFGAKRYYKVEFADGKAKRLEEYRLGVLRRQLSLRYKGEKLIGANEVKEYGGQRTNIIEKKNLKLRARGRNENLFYIGNERKEFKMYDGRSYVISYSIKQEEYYNKELLMERYYALYGEETRLVFSIYYMYEGIGSYLYRKYNAKGFVEKYYEGLNRWERYYDIGSKLIYSYYRTHNARGINLLLYHYGGRILKVRETYYISNWSKQSKRKLLKKLKLGFKLSKKHKEDVSKQRHVWNKVLNPFSLRMERGGKSSWIERERVTYYSEPKEAENLLGLYGGYGYEDIVGGELSQDIEKIEYYESGIKRRVEKLEGAILGQYSVESYNYFGERVFEEE